MKMLSKSFAGHALAIMLLLAATTVSVRAATLAVTTTSPLPAGKVGSPYATTLAATGGTPGYTWALVAGALPPGITMNAAGLISGGPTAAGTFNILVSVTDSAAATAPGVFSLKITGPATAIVISSAATLPDGMIGNAYSQTLTETGGTAPFGWTVQSGTLPPGLSLSSVGVISGVPTAQGTFPFLVVVTDSLASTANKIITINIDASGPARSGVISQVAS